MRWARTIFWMAVFWTVILFSIQNKDEVILRFGLYPLQTYQWEVPKIPLFLVILCSILLGVLIGSFGHLYRHFQLKRALRQNQRMIERLEREIESLSGSRYDKPALLEKNF
ncbi:MAG: LapA family protein [Thermodesulfobacteriota bacterium]